MLFLKNILEISQLVFRKARLGCSSGYYAPLRSKAHTSELHPAVVMLPHSWIGSFTATSG